MKVEILKFYPFEVSIKKPRIVAYADVEIEGLIVVKGVKLFENRYGGYFIQVPECIGVKSKVLLESIRRVVVDTFKESVRSSAG